MTHATPGATGTPSTAGPSRPATAPELSITTLRPGGTITLPATLGCTITGAHLTAWAGYRLRLALGGSGTYSLDLLPSSPSSAEAGRRPGRPSARRTWQT
ncbi:hypothetical protein [Streptomyces camelliae]|uniref:Ig-like domain-containing protein n=1 Tax=Streptomyces camelliae TaxID=3004093 RepID=A0ABY7PI05_9ACTN|nr:hypothetical protein [Streptomyces sp. HUAS 2-6]WBO68591.1 hypothetical protein O1G22_40165 [Streptomyces sp. HUAS 2-6]